MTYTERQQWFRDRIGKIIWRNKTTCTCLVCARVYREGLLVVDQSHADYLNDLVGEYYSEGIILEYFDTEKERDEFEHTGKPILA